MIMNILTHAQYAWIGVFEYNYSCIIYKNIRLYG